MSTKEKLKQALALRTKVRIHDKNLAQAAVLLPIFLKGGKYHILFTQRSNHVHHHKGQVAFPGGGWHESDWNLQNTALREAWEEIGLGPRDAELLGELDDAHTVNSSSFVISPFVAFIPHPYKFKVSDYECDEIFDLPIEDLIHKAKVAEDRYAVGNEHFITYSYECEGRLIWGATARILHQFLEIWKSVSGAQS
jgi:8-oxo-dGTP pyrophosphatase MutT (NUDIX family)